MNYAFMSFSCPQATFAEMLALAAQYGYDGVEPRAAGGSEPRGGVGSVGGAESVLPRTGS